MKTYIEGWIKHFQQFNMFDWLFLPNINKNMQWIIIESTVLFLIDRIGKIRIYKLMTANC